MNHNDDAYAAMLLTMALSPDKEEYAHPFSAQEFRRMEAVVRASQYRRLGALLDADISGLMMYLGLSEAEGYRAYTLLNRTVQLTYALSAFEQEGIEVATLYDAGYPERLRRKLGESAPVFFYYCGDLQLLSRPAVAVMAVRGARSTEPERQALDALVRGAGAQGYAVVTGGELGLSRMAESAAAGQGGGTLIDVLSGGMMERVQEDALAQMIGTGRGVVLSLEHPQVVPSIRHAIARSKVIFALADAAFVFNTDGRRGELEALQEHTCDWIYAWEPFPGNHPLIARGAKPLHTPADIDVAALSRHWNSSRSEQITLFDWMNGEGAQQ